MSKLKYSTLSKNQKGNQHDWFIIDAENQILGRLSSRVSSLLRGKHKACFAPHMDCSDHVVIINSAKVRLTGKKWSDKKIITYSGYPGGQKILSAIDWHTKHPDNRGLIERAIKRMLPKNALNEQIFSDRLHIYRDAHHPHEANNPKPVKI